MGKYILTARYLIIIFLFFFVIEFLSRIFIWGVTGSVKAFNFGINKNIQINIFHLRKLDIKIEDLGLVKMVTEQNSTIDDNKNLTKKKGNYYVDFWRLNHQR